uniref:hypothetical protein n=1 Tax=Nonomuraea lactucae TaxID=2249762 RepID=UPI00196523D3
GPVEVPAGGVAGTDRPLGTVTGASGGWAALSFGFGDAELRVMAPVMPRSGLYATYGGGPSPTASR